MKKTLICLIFGAFLSLHGYEVMLWGDMHYSRPRHLGRPEKLDAGLRKYSGSLERRWDAYNPDFVKHCAAIGKRCDFAIQLGDVTDGHFGTVEKHVEALQTVADELRSRWGKPIEFIKGNHENYDGVEAKKGYALAMPDGLNRIRMHGGDLYVFFNSEEPDLEFARQALTSHPEAEQVFFFTHRPVAPCIRSKYAFDLLFGDAPASRDVLLKLLADRRATIFCGHIHELTRTVFTEPQTGRQLVQVSLFTMIYSPRQGDGSLVMQNGSQFFDGKFVNDAVEFNKFPATEADFWKKSLISWEIASWESTQSIPGFAILQKESGDAKLLLYFWSSRETPVALGLTPQK